MGENKHTQGGFVKNANDIVQPNQTVNVRVMSVDASTGRIALSMKGLSGWYTTQHT
jgi:predicted RNA-binding protein with RPS1 domain